MPEFHYLVGTHAGEGVLHHGERHVAPSEPLPRRLCCFASLSLAELSHDSKLLLHACVSALRKGDLINVSHNVSTLSLSLGAATAELRKACLTTASVPIKPENCGLKRASGQ